MQTAATRARRKVNKNDMQSRRLVEVDTDSATSLFFDKLVDEIHADTVETDVDDNCSTTVGWEIYETGESNSDNSKKAIREDAQTTVTDITVISKVEASGSEIAIASLSKYNEEKQSELTALFSAYGKCQSLQNCGLYQIAFRHYCKLMPFLTCDGLFWLRIAECCIYARFKANLQCPIPHIFRQHDIGNDDVSFMSIFLNNDIPCKKLLFELDKEGMTLDYAEVALNNCILLVDDERDKFLKDHATTLSSFISMKSKRFRNSLWLLRNFNHTTDPRIILRALLIEAEIDLHAINKQTDEKLLNIELLSRTAWNQEDAGPQWYALLLGYITKQDGNSAERMFEVYKNHAKPRSNDLILGVMLCKKMNMMDQFCNFLGDMFNKSN